MKTTFSPLILVLLLSGCNHDKTMIKKNLNSRFTKYEIIEIRPDTANVNQAFQSLISLEIGVSETNLKISSALNDIVFRTGNKTPQQNLQYIESLHNEIVSRMDKFEKTQFDRVDPCYYVKFFIYKEEQKIPKEEYFYINRQNDDIIQRPCDWNEYLLREKYDELIKKALKNFNEINELKDKYSNK